MTNPKPTVQVIARAAAILRTLAETTPNPSAKSPKASTSPAPPSSALSQPSPPNT